MLRCLSGSSKVSLFQRLFLAMELVAIVVVLSGAFGLCWSEFCVCLISTFCH